NVVFTIVESDQYRIGLIGIFGNTITQQRIIRRSLRIFPEQLYNTVAVKESRQRLIETRLFDEVDIVSVNDSNAAGSQSPKLTYLKSDGQLRARWRGVNDSGATYYVVENANVVADGATWNVALVYRRNGRLFLNVNGVESTDSPTLSFATQAPEYGIESRIGSIDPTAPAWAYDRIIFGQSELSEAIVDKLVGWAMQEIDRAEDLPAGHPYLSSEPRVDEENFPSRYQARPAEWEAWWARNPKTARQAHLGEPAPSDDGYTRVFLDDFRSDSVERSDRSEGGEDAIWYGSGWNTAVGGDAQMLMPGKEPDLYAHDPEAQTLTLSLAHAGGWKA
ncbi:hypothetical protein LCGC14_3166360, partial [marine sediment metagenome]